MFHNSKRLISIILLSVLVFTAGCAQTSGDHTADGNVSKVEVLAKTKTHTIRRIDGQCYLDLKAGNKKIDLYDGGCLSPAVALEYESVEEMYQNLMYESLSEDDIATIQYAFQLSDYGFLIPDPTQLYDLVLPSNVEPRGVDLRSFGYELWFREKGAFPDHNIVGYLTILPQDDFSKQLDKFYDPFKNGTAEYDTVTELPDKNGVAYDTIAEHGTMRNILYTVQDDTKTLQIKESYILPGGLDPRASEEFPIIIDIYGQENGLYYIFHSNGYYATIPAYSLIPYQP